MAHGTWAASEDPDSLSVVFLVEGALYYERDTKFSEPNAPNNPSLVTVGPNSGDGIVIMMSGT